MSFNPFEGAFGLDISENDLKMVRVHTKFKPFTTEFHLQSYGRAVLPAGAIHEGEIVRPEAVIAVLKKLLSKASTSKNQKWVTVGLPENKTYLKYISLPTEEKIDQTGVLSYASEHFPVELDTLYIDWQVIPLSANSPTKGLLITAVPKTIADSYAYMLEIAGLSPIEFCLESVALARAIVKAREEEQPQSAYALLDLGAEHSTFVIYADNSVQFSQTFDFGGDTITRVMKNIFNLKKDTEAEEKKASLGVVSERYSPHQWLAVGKELDTLAENIKTVVSFYTESPDFEHTIEKIYLSGGTSNLEGIDKILSTKLKMPVHAGNPWQNLFSKKLSPLTQTELNTYATAIGLALRAADNPLIERDDS
jgi:type IV pilus assembly protein PilM